MRRLVRIVAVTLLLAALPTLAWAEYAWVLWDAEFARAPWYRRWYEGPGRVSYSIVGAYETKAACETDRHEGMVNGLPASRLGNVIVEREKAKEGVIDLTSEGRERKAQSKRGISDVRRILGLSAVCLPDTVRPQ